MNPQGTTPPPGATPPHGDGASNSPTNPNDIPALVNTVGQHELAVLGAVAYVLRPFLIELESRPAEAEASAPTGQDPALTLCDAVINLLGAEQRLRACLLGAVPLDAAGEVWRQRALEAQRRAMAEYDVKEVKVYETLIEESGAAGRAAYLARRGAEGGLPDSRIARD